LELSNTLNSRRRQTGNDRQADAPELSQGSFSGTGARVAGTASSRGVLQRKGNWLRGRSHREALRSVVQRERDTRKILDPDRNRPGVFPDSLPGAAGALDPRQSRGHGPGQRGRSDSGTGKRASSFHERADDGNPLYGPGRGISFDRPGDRRESRRGLALPVPADRRFAGILRREHPAQYELGSLRAASPTRDAPSQALRAPFRPARAGLGRAREERPGCRARGRVRAPQVARKAGPGSPGRASGFDPGPRKGHYKPAAPVLPRGSSAL